MTGVSEIIDCAACGKPFKKKRAAQVACSPACKQALWRQNRNASDNAPREASRASPAPVAVEPGTGSMRLYPGNNPLSEIECRVMGLVYPGRRRDGEVGVFYERVSRG